jgi:hypothetical protein
MTRQITLAIRPRRAANSDEDGEQPGSGGHRQIRPQTHRRRFRTEEDHEEGEQPRG